jgi:uncharacterized damage-inducible protein DinB
MPLAAGKPRASRAIADPDTTAACQPDLRLSRRCVPSRHESDGSIVSVLLDGRGARGGVETLVWLLDDAFGGRGIESSNESQALLTNLATVDDGAWRARPAGAVRTIESIALHVGACKVMYHDYAFGTGQLHFGTPEVEPWGPDGPAPRDAVVGWLERVHARLVAHVAALPDDAELDRPRPVNWGGTRPTRWIIAALITHDSYHAGEINHLRSLVSGDDRWRHVQLGFG